MVIGQTNSVVRAKYAGRSVAGFILTAWEKLPSLPRRSRSAGGAHTAAVCWSVPMARAQTVQPIGLPSVNTPTSLAVFNGHGARMVGVGPYHPCQHATPRRCRVRRQLAGIRSAPSKRSRSRPRSGRGAAHVRVVPCSGRLQDVGRQYAGLAATRLAAQTACIAQAPESGP
jgi:hypothetical protein